MFGLSLRASLAALSAASLILAIALGALSLRSLDTVNAGSHDLSADIARVANAGAMSSAFNRLRIAEAEHGSSTGEAAKRAAEAAIAAAKTTFAEALGAFRRSLQPADEAQRAVIERIDAAIKTYATLDATYVEYSSTYREIDAGALFITDMKTAHAAISAMLEELVAISARDATATEAENDATYTRAWTILLALICGATLVSAASAAFGFFGVSRPMDRLRDAMARLANGDLDAATPFAGRRDEIGAMAAAVETFKQGLKRARALEQETADARAGAEAQRRAATYELADRFEQAIGSVVATVATASTELKSTAESMTGVAGRTAARSSDVAAAAQQAAGNVTMVAAASEELGASVQEIARQVTGSADLAKATVTDAERTGQLVHALSESAAKIGDVVEIIAQIAGQTNLLALNATIEAARAGEAGRGFAIVANEVKALAAQTAKATEEIGRHVTGIQATTDDAVEAIEAIGGRIRSMSDLTASIAVAVEEQGAATQEIVRNVTQAAQGTTEVTANMGQVAAAADETGVSANQVLRSATGLLEQSGRLGSEVSRFLASVRAA